MDDDDEVEALVKHLMAEQHRPITPYPPAPGIPWKALRAEFDEWDRRQRA